MLKYLYVIRAPGGARKVGFSRDPEKRRRNLSTTGFVCALEYAAPCPDGMERPAEKHAHALLWDRWRRGEWFDVDANTARRAVISGIMAAREGEELWEPSKSYGVWRVMTRCPDNMWREVDLLRI